MHASEQPGRPWGLGGGLATCEWVWDEDGELPPGTVRGG